MFKFITKPTFVVQMELKTDANIPNYALEGLTRSTGSLRTEPDRNLGPSVIYG